MDRPGFELDCGTGRIPASYRRDEPVLRPPLSTVGPDRVGVLAAARWPRGPRQQRRLTPHTSPLSHKGRGGRSGGPDAGAAFRPLRSGAGLARRWLAAGRRAGVATRAVRTAGRAVV